MQEAYINTQIDKTTFEEFEKESEFYANVYTVRIATRARCTDKMTFEEKESEFNANVHTRV